MAEPSEFDSIHIGQKLRRLAHRCNDRPILYATGCIMRVHNFGDSNGLEARS